MGFNPRFHEMPVPQALAEAPARMASAGMVEEPVAVEVLKAPTPKPKASSTSASPPQFVGTVTLSGEPSLAKGGAGAGAAPPVAAHANPPRDDGMPRGIHV